MNKQKQAARPNFPNTRKALRKQKRQQKKVHRQEHYLKKKPDQEQPKFTPGRFVKRPADDPDPVTETKKQKTKSQPLPIDIIQKERLKEKKEADRLKAQMEEQRRKTFLEANDEEDKMIKRLEKQLGLNKVKNKKKFFEDDGLDYLLEICDRQTTEQIVAAEKHLANVEGESDFEEDLAAVTGKELKKDKKVKKDNKKTESDDDSFSDDGSDISGDEDQIDDDLSGNENQEDSMDKDMSGGESDENGYGDEDDFSDNIDSEEEPEEKPMKSSKSKQKVKEKAAPDKLEKKKNKEKVVTEEELSKMFSDDEVSHLSDDGAMDEFGDELENEDMDNGDDSRSKEKPDVWEDIYGRKRDKEGNVIKEEKGVYIPPHLRNKEPTDQATAQLKRQIKSVLNKLAHTNLHWACTSIETLYSSNSRHAVSSTLSALWRDAVCGVSNTPCRLAAEHAALVGVLHANVGSEIGAHFLEELCTIFDQLMRTPQPMEDKTLDNVVCALAYLYSFKIYHATLLYDILTRLVADLTEKGIDCVLAVFRCAGAALRKDEPLALKTFIHGTQARAAKLGDSADSGSRIKFLLEVLMAVKNNNLTKIPNYDPSFLEQLKKTVRGIVRKGNYVTPLNITLEDLLKADTRGKWWVVGSAWEGNRPLPEQKAKALPSTDQKLLDLARKQRMNTDVRRSIFCVIMSAEDYMDAFEKLQHLGLKGNQEREIVHVLLACCLQEKTYNPYYSVLAQKLCDVDRKYQLSIQFAVWDKIKDMEGMSKHCMANLAQFLIHLIMEKGLALSVLKVIQFSDLNKSSVRFLRQVLLAIIMNADLQASLQVFHRIAKSPKLHMFRESLRLFIQHFLLKNAGRKSSVLSDEDMRTLKARTVEVDKILTMFESKLKF